MSFAMDFVVFTMIPMWGSIRPGQATQTIKEARSKCTLQNGGTNVPCSNLQVYKMYLVEGKFLFLFFSLCKKVMMVVLGYTNGRRSIWFNLAK